MNYGSYSQLLSDKLKICNIPEGVKDDGDSKKAFQHYQKWGVKNLLKYAKSNYETAVTALMLKHFSTDY